ncbi:MAG: type II 3-dehydroquinate dehydratase [Legionellaceae bacterium]|nr:type II 3-dehydroquinate dehydratase [Legionellaceae bacterium]
MKKISVIHGPNLDRLGQRQPAIYGHTTLATINHRLAKRAQETQFILTSFQSNCEGTLIDHIHQQSEDGCDAIIINPAAYTHSSIALRDALLAVAIPFIEVHLSNIFAREPFRQHSFLSDVALAVISGLGPDSYYLALEAFIRKLTD